MANLITTTPDDPSIIRPLIRVRFDDETSWGEHVKDDIYRSLNSCLNAVSLELPADIDMATMPEGHPGPDRNGMMCRMHWGHLFRGKALRQGVIVPLAIIGWDGLPRTEAKG